MNEIVKKDEIINFNGYEFICLVDKLETPQIITKSYLKCLCYEEKLKEL